MVETAIIKVDDASPAIRLVLDGLDSPNSKAVYRTALVRFHSWYVAQGQPFSKRLVQAYRQHLLGTGLAPASINLALCAVRQLALEAGDNGLLDPNVAAAIGRVSGVKAKGRRIGQWLSKEQALELLTKPDVSTLSGLRDRAILAVMMGGGLRRAEVCSLEVSHFQQRDGRWVIVDLVGKGQRVRSVPVPFWAKECVDEWLEGAGIEGGFIFRRITKGEHVQEEPLTDRGMHYVIAECYGINCHDLRRTFGRLAYQGGSDLKQIQYSLGHSSVKTTEVYLGTAQDFQEGQAPCDKLGLGLEA